jgi:hypothetical protein
MAGPPIYSPNLSPIQQKAKIFISALDFVPSGTSVLTRGAKGIWYWAQAASQTVTYGANLRAILRNYTSAVVNYGITEAKNAPLSLIDVIAYYLSAAVAPTTLTVGITDTTYPASGVATAPTVVDLLAPAALTPTINADIYATKVVPTNTGLLANSNDELLAEVAVVTPTGGTFRLYGLLVELNYNV